MYRHTQRWLLCAGPRTAPSVRLPCPPFLILVLLVFIRRTTFHFFSPHVTSIIRKGTFQASRRPSAAAAAGISLLRLVQAQLLKP